MSMQAEKSELQIFIKFMKAYELLYPANPIVLIGDHDDMG